MVNRDRFKDRNENYGTLSVYHLAISRSVRTIKLNSDALVHVEWKRKFDGLATVSNLRLPRYIFVKWTSVAPSQLDLWPNKWNVCLSINDL